MRLVSLETSADSVETFNADVKLNIGKEFISAKGEEITPELTVDGLIVSSGYELVSDNEDVAKIVDNKVVGVSEGKVNITAFVDNDIDKNVLNATLTGEYQTLVTLTFKVKNTAFNASDAKIASKLELSIDSLIDKDEKKNVPDLTEAVLNIDVYKLADVNEDGDVNDVDYLAIQRIIDATDKYDARADLNGDGKVSVGDLAALQKILVGRYAYKDVANSRA
jgi:Tfp pilus tip-associated adhesin PilY1